MTWKEAEEEGGIKPFGGLTRNLLGEEVWTLNAIGVDWERDVRVILVLHLHPKLKSILTSCSVTCTYFFSISISICNFTRFN